MSCMTVVLECACLLHSARKSNLLMADVLRVAMLRALGGRAADPVAAATDAPDHDAF
jgi:hypothetical protein